MLGHIWSALVWLSSTVVVVSTVVLVVAWRRSVARGATRDATVGGLETGDGLRLDFQ